MRGAIVQLNARISGDVGLECRKVEIDEVQFGGIRDTQNVAREISSLRADLGDAAAARQMFYEIIARRADAAVGDQMCGKSRRRLAGYDQVTSHAQHVAHARGQPLAQGQTDASKDDQG